MAPLVVYLMSTLCARGGFDNLRTRVAPAAAAYGARLEHPIVAVVDECGDLGLLACERCAPSPLAPLVASEGTTCDGVDVIVASCPGGKFGPGPGCKTDAAVAHFARRFPATNPAWLAFSDDDMHYFVPWFAALLRFVEGAGHSAAVPLALGGRDRKFKTERIQASFHRFKDRAPCLLTGAPRIVLPLVLSSAAAEKLAPLCLNRVTEKQCGAFRTTHDTCFGVVIWRLGMPYLPVFEECRLVTNCVEIKFRGASRTRLNHNLHAIDATPARWRGDAGSSPLDGARTTASSPRNDLVKNCRVHPAHWLISTQSRASGSLLVFAPAS